MEPPGLFVHSPEIIAPPSKPAPSTPRDAAPPPGLEEKHEYGSNFIATSMSTRLPRQHVKAFKKSNSFDGFQHNFNITNDPPGLDRTTVVHDEDFVSTSKDEKSEEEDDDDAPLPPGIHRRPSKNSHMFLNEFSESKGELDVHPSVHKFEDLVRRISISSLDEAKPDNQSRGVPSAERNFEKDYFNPSTPDDETNSAIQTRQMSMQSLDATSPVDNIRKGVASASVLRTEVSRDGPVTPDPKTNVVEPLIVASPTQMEMQRLMTEKIVKEEKQRREEEKQRRKSLLRREKPPLSFLDALNSEAKTVRNERRERTQRNRARKLLEEMKEHESASRRLSKLDMDIVKTAQVANGIISPDLINGRITKEKPHFVSDGPPGIHRRLSHGSKQYLVELHEKFDGHKSLNQMSHSASSLHDQLHYFAEPGSKHYVPEWKRRREVMLKQFEERLEREEEEEKKEKKKKQTVLENSVSIDKNEIAKYVRQRHEAKFMLGIKLMERNAIEKSRHVHERRVHNLLLGIADSEKIDIVDSEKNSMNNEKKGSSMRMIDVSSPKKSIQQVSPKMMSQHKPQVELRAHKVISPHQAKRPQESAYTLPFARLRKCWDAVMNDSCDGISTLAQFMTLLAGISKIVFPSTHPLMARLARSRKRQKSGPALRAFLVNNILIRAEELYSQLRRTSSSSVTASHSSSKMLLRVLFHHYLGRFKSVHFDVLVSMLQDCGIRLTRSDEVVPDIRSFADVRVPSSQSIRRVSAPTTTNATTTTITTSSKDSFVDMKRDRISLRDVVRGNMESLRFLYGAILMSRTRQRKECSRGLDGGDYENMMTLLLPGSIMFHRALRRSFVDGTHIGPLQIPRAGVVRDVRSAKRENLNHFHILTFSCFNYVIRISLTSLTDAIKKSFEKQRSNVNSNVDENSTPRFALEHRYERLHLRVSFMLLPCMHLS